MDTIFTEKEMEIVNALANQGWYGENTKDFIRSKKFTEEESKALLDKFKFTYTNP